MTAGQGGPDDQGGQFPPQGPPVYPGPGQPPPYGYAPGPPGGWGGPPPPAMERPTTVRIGIGAFVATLLLGLISAVVQFADVDDLIDQIRDQEPSITEDAARAGVVAFAVIALLFVAIEALFIWFAWSGRNWARIVLLVVGALGVLSGLAGLSGAGTANVSGFLTSMSVFTLVLTLVGVVALALKPSVEWYRHEGARRSAMR